MVIKSENETNPMPDVKEVTIKDNGKVEIGPMTYTKPEDIIISFLRKRVMQNILLMIVLFTR